MGPSLLTNGERPCGGVARGRGSSPPSPPAHLPALPWGSRRRSAVVMVTWGTLDAPGWAYFRWPGLATRHPAVATQTVEGDHSPHPLAEE